MYVPSVCGYIIPNADQVTVLYHDAQAVSNVERTLNAHTTDSEYGTANIPQRRRGLRLCIDVGQGPHRLYQGSGLGLTQHHMI